MLTTNSAKRGSPAPRTSSTKARVGITSSTPNPTTTATHTSTRPALVTIKSPSSVEAASPGQRSAVTKTTTNTATTTSRPLVTSSRPVIQPKETHASRALASARAAAAASSNPNSNTNSQNTARSGSATARSGSATARTTATTNNTAAANNNSNGGQQPFHRPNLVSKISSVNAQRMTPIATASSQPKRSSSANSNSSRASHTAAVERSGSAVSNGAGARSPSPVTIRPKRCKHCSGLVSDLDKHLVECPMAPTECKLRDSENSTSGCGFVARGLKHLDQHQHSECPFRLVDCRNAEIGCTDQVSISSMDRHVDNRCLFAVCLCEYCKHPVTRGHHEAHISTECPAVKVLCPLGCGRDFLRSALTAHIQNEWKDANHPRSKTVVAGNNANNYNVDLEGNQHRLPPESARRVAESLLTCLEVVTQQKETETILAPSDEIDEPTPLGGDATSLEHALFVGQCVLRTIHRLEKYCASASSSKSSSFSSQLAQSVFELVERRTEAAKTRLAKHTENSQLASALKSSLETHLGKVALQISCGDE